MALLHDAVKSGNLEYVNRLILVVKEFNPDTLNDYIHKTNTDGQTPLHVAAKEGHLDIVKYLKDNGAEDTTNSDKQDSVHAASEAGHMDVVMYLLKKGPKDKDNRISLSNAASYGNKNIIVSILQKHISDYINSSKGDDGRTALHRAAEVGDIDTVTYLLMNGAEYNTKDKYGCTPLHYAAILVQYINEKSDNGFTALHNAAMYGKVDIVTYLLNKDAEYNTKDMFGETPLHPAAVGGHKDVIVSLITHVHNHNPDILVQYINEKSGQGVPALHYAAMYGHVDMVTYLLDKGAEYNNDKLCNMTPLHYAAIKGNKDVVESLITHVHNNNPDILKQYINEKSDNGVTALHYAAMCDHVDIVTYLLDKGAEYNTKNKLCNMTPLHYAARGGHKDIVVSLITHAHNNNPYTLKQYMNEEDNIGKTSLDYAKEKENKETEQYLIKMSNKQNI